MRRNGFLVMHPCTLVVLSYLDAVFEPWCGRKDFWTACCLLLLPLLAAVAAETCYSPWDPTKTRTRTQLGPSLA